MARQNSKDKGVFERPVDSGIWWVRIFFRGREIRKRVGSKTAAKAYYEKLKTEQREGRLWPEKYAATKGTFRELAQDLITDYEINGRRSIVRAKENIERLKEFFGECHVTDITSDLINAYIIKRQKQGVKNGTINRELKILSRMFTLGMERTPKKVTSVPYIPHLEENNVRTGFFEQDEFLSLRGALPEYAKLPVTIAYYTGMRSGEILSLTWKQVDVINKQLTLSPLLTKNKTERKIFLYGELYDMISTAWEAWQWQGQSCPWVCHKEGKRIKTLRSAWSRATKQIGLENMLFHDFRRTGIRNMVRAGIPDSVAMTISGHKTRSVFDRYNIVSEDDLKAAAQKMMEYLQPAPNPAPEPEGVS
ncbi:MAG: site-specific integrase [Nitrospirae bacterium]|nr:site-specific integrase [Nitrospirota bacterium]